jgi:hypothetical protein
MKKLLLFIFLAILTVNVAFADEKEPPHVMVFGTATTDVVPNEMNWSVQVQTKGMKLDAVAQEHDTNVQKVLSLLKDSKLPDKDIQTPHMQFGENWEYKNSRRYRDGYVATTVITFKLHDFSLYKKLWLGLADMPSVSVESVSFDNTNRIELQNSTRRKAIQAARQKATELAQAIGSEIAEPLFIEEEQMEIIRPMFNAAMNARAVAAPAGDEEGESLAPGTIPIKARVHASFRLVTSPK